ncbi:MAG: Cys-tRNA(Pro) deacylase [Propionibacteriaceae bacterium]|jgi:Cys-tRNA(Pro)/Cys-tRNA(Cys) deacylase|nr:Cys-tRNA(Pro) deacylase [Propionibacteriaceae bacterium]
MAKKPSAGTAAIQALTKAKVLFTLHEYEHTPGETHFGEETVARLGLDPARVFKTLLAEVTLNGKDQLVVGVVPMSGQMDLKALAAAVGAKKAAMADPAAAERATGYVVGGISPFGQKTRHVTVVDESATGFPTVYVSAGRRGLQVEVDPADLIRLTAAATAPIGR